jgi:4-hydroxybenzoate polyprenyltransferase
MKRILLFLQVSRPFLWPLAPFIFLVGIVYSKAILSMPAVLEMALLTFPLCFITFGINDVYDYYSDKLNPRKNTYEGFVLKPKYHPFVIKIALLMSTLLILSSLLTLNLGNIFSMILLLLTTYFYSAKPIRLKEKPPFDSLSNGLMILFAFFLGYSLGKSLLSIEPKIIMLGLCVSGVHAYTTIMDYTVDKKTKTRTFSVVFGKRAAALFPLVLFVIAFFLNFAWPIKLYLGFSSALFLISSLYVSEKISRIFTKLLFGSCILCSFLYLVMPRI